MPIVVDKEAKRRAIALACKDLILQEGIDTLTVSRIAKEAGIGKGTFYEYFESKEALLFTLVTILMEEYNCRQERKLAACTTSKEKIKCFAGFFYDEEAKELRALYKLFNGIALLHANEAMRAFQGECLDYYYDWFERLLEEGVRNGELDRGALDAGLGLFAMAKGMFLLSETTDRIEDLKYEIESFIDTIYHYLTSR